MMADYSVSIEQLGRGRDVPNVIATEIQRRLSREHEALVPLLTDQRSSVERLEAHVGNIEQAINDNRVLDPENLPRYLDLLVAKASSPMGWIGAAPRNVDEQTEWRLEAIRYLIDAGAPLGEPIGPRINVGVIAEGLFDRPPSDNVDVHYGQILDELTRSGADIRHGQETKTSPLLVAIVMGHSDRVIVELVRHGARLSEAEVEEILTPIAGFTKSNRNREVDLYHQTLNEVSLESLAPPQSTRTSLAPQAGL